MANVLILDDESVTLSRLLKVLSQDKQHKLWTSDSLAEGGKVLKQLGSALDLLILDVSLLSSNASELLEQLAESCPQAKLLAVGPHSTHPSSRDLEVLRKPFTDEHFVEAVEKVLALDPVPIATAQDTNRKPQHKSSCVERRPGRVRAASR